MRLTDADYSWLPDHQLHVAATLAHVDDTIDRALRLVHDYSERGPLTLVEIANGDRLEVVVDAIAPLPQAIPRLVADALTQLRAALEHTLYAEVEAQLGRSLTHEEGRSIEMPALTEADAWVEWLKNRRRRQLPPLQAGAPLVRRIERLQPFRRRDFDEHPLRLLVAHTNLAKHRTPAVAATRLGAVYPDDPRSDLAVALAFKPRPQPGDGLPLQVGDVLAHAPHGQRIPLSVVATVSLQRPHSGAWNIVAHELGLLEEWVRTTAVPILITGTHDVPALPPQLDVSTGYKDGRRGLTGAGRIPATERARTRIVVATARAGLVDVLALSPESPEPEAVRAWADSLTAADVRERTHRLERVRADLPRLQVVFRALTAEVRAHRVSRHERRPTDDADLDAAEIPRGRVGGPVSGSLS